jgi:hypothetical protein
MPVIQLVPYDRYLFFSYDLYYLNYIYPYAHTFLFFVSIYLHEVLELILLGQSISATYVI